MKIAQIAPLTESCPPRLYGGTERIVSYLTEELVRQGHEVTLFASGDFEDPGETGAACSEMALRLNPTVRDQLPYHVMMIEEVRRRAARVRRAALPHRLPALPARQRLCRPHGHDPARPARPARSEAFLSRVPAICRWSRSPTISDGRCRRVQLGRHRHHGLPEDLLPFTAQPKGGYLAFLGRISPEKRPTGDRNRRARRDEAEDRRQGRQRRSGLLERDDRADGRSASQCRVHRRDQRAAEGRASSAMRAPCCSRSTGRSRSAS